MTIHWQSSPYFLPLVFTALLLVILARIAWMRRPAHGAATFALLMLAAAFWSLGYALELASADLTGALLWSNLQYLGIVIITPTWLVFILEYTGQGAWLTRRKVYLLLIGPLLILLFVWTNEFHHLFYTAVRSAVSGPYTLLNFEFGPLFWVNVSYSYLLLGCGDLLLVRELVRSPHIPRGQIVAMLLTACAPWAGSAAFVFGITPFPGLDLTPFGFAFTGLVVTWALFRYRLLDIIPVAREAVVEAMRDPVIIMDPQDRIADLNRAAQELLGGTSTGVLKGSADTWLFARLARPDLAVSECGIRTVHAEVSLGAGEFQRFYELLVSPLRDHHGGVLGRSLVLRDITERKQVDAQIHRHAARAEALARVAARLNARLDLDTVLHTMCDETASALKVPAAWITLFDPKQDAFVYAASAGLSPEFGERYVPLPRTVYEKYVQRQGQLVILDDASALTRSPNARVYASQNIRTVANASMLRAGELVGMLSIATVGETRRFNEDERVLLQGLADQAAQAITNARLLAESFKRADEFAALYETTRNLSTQRDLPALLQTIVAQVTTLIHAPGGGIYLYDAARAELEMKVAIGAAIQPGARLKLGQGMAGQVAQTRQPLIVSDYATWDHRAFQYQAIPFRAVVEVPMLYGGDLIGVLVANETGSSARKFTEDDVRLLTLFASQAAGVVHNARLFDETRRRLTELSAVNRISTLLRTAQTLEEMLPNLLDETLALLGTTAGQIALYDSTHDELRVAVARDWFTQTPNASKLGASAGGRVFLTGQPHVTHDWFHDPLTSPGARPLVPEGWGGVIIPLRAGAKIIGVLRIAVAHPREIQPDEVQLLTTLAEIAGSAIQRARLLAETQQRADRLTLLNRIARNLGTTLDLDDLLAIIYGEITTVMPADAFFIALYDPSTTELDYRIRMDQGVREPVQRRLLKPGFTSRIIETQKPLLIRDFEREKEHLPAAALWGSMQAPPSWLGVPILFGDDLIGVISVQAYRPYAYGEGEQELLSTIADSVAVAIRNAQLFEELQASLAMTTRLYQLSGQILSAHTLEETASLTCQMVRDGFAADAASIHLQSAEGRDKYQYQIGLNSQVTSPYPDALAGPVLVSGEPMMITDSDLLHPDLRAEGIRALIALPLRGQATCLGLLYVNYRQPHQFAEREVQLLSLFANQTALALERVRLMDETRRRLDELEAVNRISTALRVAQTLEDMLPLLVAETCAALHTTSASIWLQEGTDGRLHQVAASGLPNIPVSLEPGEGIAGQVFLTGEPYVSAEFRADPRTNASARSHVPSGLGGAAVPIRAAQNVIGVLFVSNSSGREAATLDVNLLTTLAEMAGNAIHRARLNRETARRVQHLIALHTIDESIISSLDLPHILDVLLQQITLQLQVDAADVLLLNSDTHRLEYAASRGFRTEALKYTLLHLGEGLAGKAALNRRMVRIADLRVQLNGLGRSPLLPNEEFIGYYGVPLQVKGQVKGVLEIFHRAPIPADAEWEDLLNSLATQAAIAIENSSLFDHLQRSNAQLALSYEATLEGWTRALDLRDKETEGHTQRVAGMTLRLARALALPPEEIAQLQRGALLHDIGKMGIPDSILLKPGALSAEEWDIMRKHTEYAYELLSPIAYLRPALDIPYCHHEKWDGTGYPRGLKGEEIPLAARIFAIVDVWDALRSDRPYRKAWSDARVQGYLCEQSGKHFEPRIVEAFLAELKRVESQPGEA